MQSRDLLLLYLGVWLACILGLYLWGYLRKQNLLAVTLSHSVPTIVAVLMT